MDLNLPADREASMGNYSVNSVRALSINEGDEYL
jgi:hypothetical protein